MLQLGRLNLARLTNKSGGAVAKGDVVVLDTANAESFTTTTVEKLTTRTIGVVLEPNGIANNSAGIIALAGPIDRINLDGAAGIGNYLYTDSVAKQGTPSATLSAGAFGQALTASATPSALLWGFVLQDAIKLNTTEPIKVEDWLGTNRTALFREALMRGMVLKHITPVSGWAQAVTGSGNAANRDFFRAYVSSGATGTSTALGRSPAEVLSSPGKLYGVINFDKRIVLTTSIMQGAAGTANGRSRITLGKTVADGVGVLARRGIGFEVRNKALWGICHNGTTLVSIDLTLTLTDYITYWLVVVSDGAGGVAWYVDSGAGAVQEGTSAGGPTGDSANEASILQVEVDNGGDAANQSIVHSSIELGFAL